MFSLTVVFGIVSLAALLVSAIFILRQLGADDAARGLAMVSGFCLFASLLVTYLG